MERVQKIASRLIMGDQTEYKESPDVLKLKTLKEKKTLAECYICKKEVWKTKKQKAYS